MSHQWHVWHKCFFYQLRCLSWPGVNILSEIGVRPTIESLFLYTGKVIGHQFISQAVPLIDRCPQNPRSWRPIHTYGISKSRSINPLPAPVRIYLQYSRSTDFMLHAIFTHITARSYRNVYL